MNTLGERIKYARKIKGITQTKIKELCGISSGNLSEIENDKVSPTSNALLSLKRILGVSVDWLLTGEGEMFPSNVGTQPKPVEIPPFAIEELNGEQKELLMAFSCLDSHGKYAVKNFTIFQMTQQNLTQTSSSSPPSNAPNNTGEIA